MKKKGVNKNIEVGSFLGSLLDSGARRGGNERNL